MVRWWIENDDVCFAGQFVHKRPPRRRSRWRRWLIRLITALAGAGAGAAATTVLNGWPFG